jgi:hypothetical protein
MEFDRNRKRLEQAMTTSVADRFKLLRKDLEDLVAESHVPAFDAVTSLAYEMPLVGGMETRNFSDNVMLLDDGRPMDESDAERSRVVCRALQKRAPFHRNKNSVADGLLIELYEEPSYPAGAVAATGMAHRGPPGCDWDVQVGDPTTHRAVRLNSATSWITGGTRARPAARRPLRPRWAGVGCRSTWAQRMP